MKKDKYDSGWLKISDEEKNKVYEFCDEYISFLNRSKTERESIHYIRETLINNGFRDINTIEKLGSGDKVFMINKNKSIYASIIGNNPFLMGFNIIGSHIDSPRLDLKPNPLYEEHEQALFKTHYYGGIKKYQWTCIPLSMRGIVIKSNGEILNICIGENDDEPIFTITDLLPHLSAEQNKKKLEEAIPGENLNILVGNIPLSDEEGSKEKILKILKEKYGINKQDFISAEIEFVPAFKAKSLGFDESMVAGYGQDDRSCAYTSLMAFLDIEKPRNTCVAIFADKEEIGSMGNTGMMSNTFDSFIMKLITMTNNKPHLMLDIYGNSKMLSADVGAAIDPMYDDAYDKYNASYINHGVELNKYTGSRGKAGGSDANAEYVGYVRDILEENDILYQMSELGKIDLGGGGTIAYILANKGVDVIDCGIPILSMHSPYEVSSKLDVYMAYKTYKSFYNN